MSYDVVQRPSMGICLFGVSETIVRRWMTSQRSGGLVGIGHVSLGLVMSCWDWSCLVGIGHVSLGLVMSCWDWSCLVGIGHVLLGLVMSCWDWSCLVGIGHVQKPGYDSRDCRVSICSIIILSCNDKASFYMII